MDMKLTSMKMPKAEPKPEATLARPMEDDEEDGQECYPYGLCLTLDEDALKKLGIEELPKVGTKMALQAKVKVCMASDQSSIYGRSRRIELQITDMALGAPSE